MGSRCIVVITAIPKAELSTLEDYIMHRAHRYIASLFLTAALAAPAAIRAAAVPQVGVQVKVYDKSHKDYHNWDENEDRAYTQFHGSHKTYNATFSKTTPKQQTAYWNWRHANPDKK